VEPYNATTSDEWVEVGEAPALPESLKLYKKLLSLGIKIVFLTGRPLNQKAVTVTNLKIAGYHKWEKLILKSVFFTTNLLCFISKLRFIIQFYVIYGNPNTCFSIQILQGISNIPYTDVTKHVLSASTAKRTKFLLLISQSNLKTSEPYKIHLIIIML